MRPDQPMVKQISFWASFAGACIVSAFSACAGELAAGSAPAPVSIVSGRLLLDTSNPWRALINGSVAFAPDGKTLAVGRAELILDMDGKQAWSATRVSILSTDDGSLIAGIPLANTQGCCVAFSPDGSILAIGRMKEVRLYDARTHQKRATLKARRGGYCEKLAFSADGRRLASAIFDSVVLWDLASSQVTGSTAVPSLESRNSSERNQE
jgi:WD40 repeat protein